MAEEKTDMTSEDYKLVIREQEEAEKMALVTLSDAQIEAVTETIRQAEKLVHSVLQADVDYGIHPGTDSMALWDSGGATVANAFNCYYEHIIRHMKDDEDGISYIIEARLIRRLSGKVVAVGIGGCSTMESKYAYRWVENPEDYGLNRQNLRVKAKPRRLYRIPNPDFEDLGNTILKMASKRAEIDAAQSLPGVGSALKKLFKPRKTGDKPAWKTFWSQVNALGLTEDQVHQMLGVKSMQDWLKKGKGLNEAITTLSEALARGPETPAQFTPQEPEPPDEIPWPEDAPVNGSRLKGWHIAKSRIKAAGLTDKQVRKWFKHYGLQVGLADFEVSIPPQAITDEMLSKLVTMIDTYTAQMKGGEPS